MSSGSVYDRLFRLQATVGKLVLDGKRDPERVARILQAIVNDEVITFGFSEDDLNKVGVHQVRQVAEPKPTPLILELIGTVAAPATMVNFVASDHFKVDTSDTAMVKIGWLGEKFKKHFLGKIEEAGAECRLRVSKLLESSRDEQIRVELGDNAETGLDQIWQLLLKQPRGGEGVLLANISANIFYVREAEGMLWAVYVRWDSYCGCWRVEAAYSIGHPGRWDGGALVFSRLS